MKMPKDMWDKAICREVDGASHRLGQKERFRTMLTIILLTSFVVIMLNVSFKNEETNVVFNVLGQCLSMPSDRACPKSKLGKNWNNLLVEKSSNYTSTLISLITLNATSDSPCYGVSTSSAKLEGLPSPVDGEISFPTDVVHHLTLTAYAMDGEKRCAGGDYFEVDFHDRGNLQYKSRLPTVDFGNGSYGVELIVPSRFAGSFILEIRLLFSNWHGVERNVVPWGKNHLVVTQGLKMYVASDQMMKSLHDVSKKPLKQCTQADFDRTTWQGRWTRSWSNDSCEADGEKRFLCLPEEHFWCEEPWCFGPVGRLESNGWQYSAHCSFKIFQLEEAWNCLDGRWFFMWGDSNFQDTIRNLLLFILDWKLPSGNNLAGFQLARTYESAFTSPRGYERLFRVSQVYNGNHEEFGDWEGLDTLTNEEHQQLLLAHFNGTRTPDTIIMNSGLHDGGRFATIEAYAAAVDFAIDWWTKVYKSIPEERRPTVLWRTTITPAGVGRVAESNPNKIEMFNQIAVEKLQQVRDQLPVKFIDAFDLTFPFHYNNDYSDGGHYGRAPGTSLKPWFGAPHWYFVDLMLAHTFLNALCPST